MSEVVSRRVLSDPRCTASPIKAHRKRYKLTDGHRHIHSPPVSRESDVKRRRLEHCFPGRVTSRRFCSTVGQTEGTKIDAQRGGRAIAVVSLSRCRVGRSVLVMVKSNMRLGWRVEPVPSR